MDATSSNIEVKNNSVTDCSLYGIFIHRSHDIVITGNTIFDCDQTQLMMLNFINSNLMYNLTVNNNIFVSKSATQKTLWYQTIYTDYATTLSSFSFSGNIYARPIDDNTTMYVVALGIGGNKTLAEWKTFSGTDASSTQSPFTVTSESDLTLAYNETATAKTVSLPYTCKDLSGYYVGGSVSIPAYSSKVLFKDIQPTPPDPAIYNKAYVTPSGKAVINKATGRPIIWK